MTAADLDRMATTPDNNEGDGRSQAAIEASIRTRIVRLEQFASGLAVILDRLQGHSAAAAATVFDDFDDPDGGNEALDIAFAACSNARRDLTAMQRELAVLEAMPDPGSQQALLARLGLLGTSTRELAGRFDAHRSSRDAALPPWSPGGVVRLDEFVGMVARALRDIAQSAEGVRPPAPDVLIPAPAVASVAAPPFEPTPTPRPRPSAAAAVALPVARGLWQVLRRRRTRLMVESAGVVVVGLVILASALNRAGQGPGSLAGLESASPGPSPTSDAGVAVGGGSPSPLPSPGTSGPSESSAPSTPGPSTGAPAPPPPATPRPTHGPGPTPTSSAAVTQFNARIVSAADSIDGLLGSITAAVQDSNLPAAKAGANEIATIASTERTWLQSHPAEGCYASFQASALGSYADLITTATQIAQNADAGDGNAIHQEVGTSHGDVSALRQAGSKAVTACT